MSNSELIDDRVHFNNPIQNVEVRYGSTYAYLLECLEGTGQGDTAKRYPSIEDHRQVKRWRIDDLANPGTEIASRCEDMSYAPGPVSRWRHGQSLHAFRLAFVSRGIF